MLKVQQVELSKVKPYPGNAKTHPQSQIDLLVKQISEGFDQPIVVDKDYVIIKGHGRRLAALEMGLSSVPVIVRNDLTPQQVKAARIADNKLAETDWDMELLSQELEELSADGYNLGDLGFDTSELEELLNGFDESDLDFGGSEDDDYEIPEEIQTNIVVGDLFEIGVHRLICGDSTKRETFSRLLDGELADLVVTDPPYNVNYTGKTKDALKIKNDKMGNRDFYNFLLAFYKSLAEFTKPGGVWYVWHADSEGANFRLAMEEAGIPVRQCLIWMKNSMVMGRQDYHWKHEPCLYGWKEGAAHGWFTDRKQTTVLEFNRPTRNQEHPTMKPVELIAYQINNSSQVNQIVVDAFGGSGTTMVAGHQTKRRTRLVEFDPKYCQVILERMLKLDSTLTILKNGVEITGDIKNAINQRAG